MAFRSQGVKEELAWAADKQLRLLVLRMCYLKSSYIGKLKYLAIHSKNTFGEIFNWRY